MERRRMGFRESSERKEGTAYHIALRNLRATDVAALVIINLGDVRAAGQSSANR